MNGQYTWAWQGVKYFIPFDSNQSNHAECLGWNYYNSFPLRVNGVLLGTLEDCTQYAYPRNFLLLYVDEKFADDARIVLRFAQYAGMDVRGFDLSLLAIDRRSGYEDSDEIIIL